MGNEAHVCVINSDENAYWLSFRFASRGATWEGNTTTKGGTAQGDRRGIFGIVVQSACFCGCKTHAYLFAPNKHQNIRLHWRIFRPIFESQGFGRRCEVPGRRWHAMHSFGRGRRILLYSCRFLGKYPLPNHRFSRSNRNRNVVDSYSEEGTGSLYPSYYSSFFQTPSETDFF